MESHTRQRAPEGKRGQWLQADGEGKQLRSTAWVSSTEHFHTVLSLPTCLEVPGKEESHLTNEGSGNMGNVPGLLATEWGQVVGQVGLKADVPTTGAGFFC